MLYSLGVLYDFKRQHFERDNPGQMFPAYVTLNESACKAVRDRVSPFASMKQAITIASGLDEADIPIEPALTAAGVHPGLDILFSLDGYDTLMRMGRDDFFSHFYHLWYPVSDDMCLCDDSAEWVVFVSHIGEMYLMRAP